MSASNGIFLLILACGAGFFALNVQRLVRYMRLGQPDPRSDHPLARVKNLLTIGVGQSKIFRDSVAGPMHAAIFWGFCVLTAGTAEFVVRGVAPEFSYSNYLPGFLYRFYAVNQDVWGALVIAAVAFALFRRLTHRVARLQGSETHSGDPLLILSWIGALMVTMFSTHALDIVVDPSSLHAMEPLSFGVAQALPPMSEAMAEH